MTASTERAILAGGCFWGVQDLMRRYPGVISTRSAIRAAMCATPPIAITARMPRRSRSSSIQDHQLSHAAGAFLPAARPDHLEPPGQRPGTSYRSAIYYTTDEQRRVAKDTIADVDASGLWPAKVVTEVAPAGAFWEAEPEHQDYLQRIPHGYTCHFVRPNWSLPHRTEVRQAG